MTKKKIVVGVCVLAVAAAAGGALFLSRGRQSGMGGDGRDARGAGGPGGMGGMAQEASVTVVKAANPVRGDLSLSTGLTGTVEAADVVYVYAKASGDVTAVHVKAGDMVAAGQVICEIDTEQVDSARNSLESAQVSLSQAQNNLDRMRLLYQGGDLSEQEYEQYTNAVKSAQLQYESARIAYDRQVEYSTVTAPISGRVESCEAEVYDRVNQSGQLCVIAGEGESRITFYVTQRMMDQIREGDEVKVSRNGKLYPGHISEVSSMVDEENGLFKVKAELQNTEEIAIGSTVKLNVVTERAENVMLVPVDAVYYSGGDGYVYCYQDGIAKMTPVEVGLYDSEYAEIRSGLSVTDLVVSTWSSNLYEGAKIRLRGEDEENGTVESGAEHNHEKIKEEGAPGEKHEDAGRRKVPETGTGDGNSPETTVPKETSANAGKEQVQTGFWPSQLCHKDRLNQETCV